MTSIETGRGKTATIPFKRGVLQGSPISPILYNISVDHILDELSERSVAVEFGYQIQELDPVSVLGFADDTVLVGKDAQAVLTLLDMITARFDEIGLQLNPSKTCIINVQEGELTEREFNIQGSQVKSISNEEKIKYLGVNFTSEIVMDEAKIVTKLEKDINSIVTTPFLKQEQKITVLNTFIWPTLIYPLQSTPLLKISNKLLEDLDKMIRSAVKEVLDVPHDIPNSMLYSPKRFRGLEIFRANWEAFIKHFSICDILVKDGNPVVMACRRVEEEKEKCLEKLKLNTIEMEKWNTHKIRKALRDKEFESWSKLPSKGKGVMLMAEHTASNRWLYRREGLTMAEYREMVKMTGGVTANRAVPGRSVVGNQCRRCSNTETFNFETLPHILGSCPFGESLRNTRHLYSQDADSEGTSKEWV